MDPPSRGVYRFDRAGGCARVRPGTYGTSMSVTHPECTVTSWTRRSRSTAAAESLSATPGRSSRMVIRWQTCIAGWTRRLRGIHVLFCASQLDDPLFLGAAVGGLVAESIARPRLGPSAFDL